MEGDTKVAVIIGCSLGAAGLLLIIILLLVCCCSIRRKHNKRENDRKQQKEGVVGSVESKDLDDMKDYSYQKTGVHNPVHLALPQVTRTGSHQWRSSSSLTKPFPHTASTNQVRGQEIGQGQAEGLDMNVAQNNTLTPPPQYMESYQEPNLIPWYMRTLGRAREFFIQRPRYQSKRESGEQLVDEGPIPRPALQPFHQPTGLRAVQGRMFDEGPVTPANENDYISTTTQRLPTMTNDRAALGPYPIYDSNAALLPNDFNHRASLDSNGALSGVYNESIQQHIPRPVPTYTKTDNYYLDRSGVTIEPLYGSKGIPQRVTQSLEGSSDAGYRGNYSSDSSVTNHGSGNQMSIPRPILLGSEPRPTFLASEPRSTLVGSEPRPTLLGSEPRPILLNNEPRPTLLNTEPRPTFLGSEPRSTLVDSTRRPTLLGSEPRPTLLGAEPRSTLLDSELRSPLVDYSRRPTLLGSTNRKQVLSVMPPVSMMLRPELTENRIDPMGSSSQNIDHVIVDSKQKSRIMSQQSVENTTVGEAFEFLDEFDD